jgi:hypothetical protein
MWLALALIALAAAPVAAPTSEAPPVPTPLTPEERYARTAVTFGPDGPRMGESGPALSGPLFYDYVGRRDLAAAYRERADTLDHAGFVGAGAISGTVLPLLAGSLRFLCGRYDHFCSQVYDVLFFGSAAVMAVGAGTVLVSSAIDPDPYPPELRRSLADEYNARLRRELEPRTELPWTFGVAGRF